MDKKIKGLRWRVAGILTLDTINNYMDRMTLSVVIIQIQASLAITDSEFAMLNSLFLLAYAIMYAGGGRLVDLLGTYIGFLLINVEYIQRDKLPAINFFGKKINVSFKKAI